MAAATEPRPGTSTDDRHQQAGSSSKADSTDVLAQLNKVKLQSVHYALSQVKALATSNASEQSILVALDMLVDMALENGHPDTPLYQSLRSQATRMQDRLCVRGLCLEVLGDKSNDKVASAVNKLLKEGKTSRVEKTPKKEEPAQQPITGQPTPIPGVQQQYPQPVMPYGYPQPQLQPFNNGQGYGMQSFGYGAQGYGQGAPGYYRGNFRGRHNNRHYMQKSRALCHFCGIEGHLIKDCSSIKKLRDQVQK